MADVIVAVAVLSLFAVSGTLFMVANDSKAGTNSPVARSLVAHGPIEIHGDTDFASQASSESWSGDGTAGSPYVIAGYQIDAAGGYGVWISDCTVHFILKDSEVSDVNPSAVMLQRNTHVAVHNNSFLCGAQSGVYVSDCPNMVFMNNTCALSSNFGYGIHVEVSPGILMSGNNFTKGWGGIAVEQSEAACLRNNSCAQQHGYGVMAIGCNSSWIEDNAIIGCDGYDKADLDIRQSNGCVVARNRVDSVSAGLYLYQSSQDSISGNVFRYGYDGVLLEYSDDNELQNNSVSSCVGTLRGAMNLVSSDRNIITGNLFQDNAGLGLALDVDSGANSICNNTFLHNVASFDTYDPSHIQAKDDGMGNRWNDSTSGNRWSDWRTPDADHDGIVDLPYNISGSASARDFYPLVLVETPIAEFSVWPLLVAVVAGVIILTTRMRDRASPR